LLCAGIWAARLKALRIAVLMFVVLAFIPPTLFSVTKAESQEKWREMCAMVKNGFRAGDVIIIFSQSCEPARYYLVDRMRQNPYPVREILFVPRERLKDVRDPAERDTILSKELDPLLKGSVRAWLVWNQVFDPEEAVSGYFKRRYRQESSMPVGAPSVELFAISE
jgi:hypothetical protein